MSDFNAFLTRFKSHLGSINTTQIPEHRIQKSFESILFTAAHEPNWQKLVSSTDIPHHLKIIESLLVNDVSDTLQSCTELFISQDMLQDLLRVSESNSPIGFRKDVLRFFASITSLLDGKILYQHNIHRPALFLIKQNEPEFEDILLEMQYNLSSKIRELPQLLNVFFIKNNAPKNVPSESIEAGNASNSNTKTLNTSPKNKLSILKNQKTRTHEFPLFDNLLQHIHQSDHQGETARMAILFLFELDDGDLAKYILDSDFCDVSIAALGGLFNQLPQQIPLESSPSFQLKSFNEDLDSFLKLVEFIQKIILVCPHESISIKLLDNLKCVFLDNIFKSCIVGASDFDGTMAANLFYINQILILINQEDISRIFANFLLYSDDEEDFPGSPESINSEYKLNVRDILLSKMASLSEQVVVAVLKLFYTFLANHNQTSIYLLIEKLPKNSANVCLAPVNEQISAITQLFTFLDSESNSSGIHSIQSYLSDAEKRLETHSIKLRQGSFSSRKLLFESLKNEATLKQEELSSSLEDQVQDLSRDTTLRKFLLKLTTFFSHSYTINVALTNLLAQLSTQPSQQLKILLYYSKENLSFIPILGKLASEIIEFKNSTSDFDERLKNVRKILYSGSTRVSYEVLDVDHEFLKNVVLLEGFVKEISAILILESI